MNLIPDSPSTAELFFDYVQNTPQHVFAKFNGRELTANELHHLVQDTVRQLRDLGIESGDRVAYMLDNNLDLIVLIFSFGLDEHIESLLSRFSINFNRFSYMFSVVVTPHA